MVFKDPSVFTLNSLDQLVKSLRPEQLSCCRKYIEHFVRNGNPELENLGLYEEMQKKIIGMMKDELDSMPWR